MKFQSIIASALSIACSFCMLTSQADYTASEADLGKEINVDGTLTVSSTIDLQGKSVTYKGVTAFAGAGKFTASSASILELEVTKDATQTMAISGEISLVKSGTGKLTVSESDYKGTCEIKAGSILPKSYGNKYKYYGSNPAVTVRAGATAYLNACYGFTTSHKFILAGGSIAGGRNDTTESHVVCPKIELIANSRFAPSTSLTLGSEIQLGGYTLEVSAGGDVTYWKPSLIANGTINVTKGTLTLKTDVGSSTASLSLGPNAKILGDFVYSVKDLFFETGASVAGPVYVYGIYKPVSISAYMPTMQDGSTLDLSGLDAPIEVDPAIFPENAIITIDIGTRNPGNDYLITWKTGSEIASGRSFRVSSNGVLLEGTTAEFDAGGIKVATTDMVVDHAVWTGAVDSDFNNVKNWQCFTKLGTLIEEAQMTADTPVVFSGELKNFSLPEGKTIPYENVTFENLKLASNADFLGFDFASWPENWQRPDNWTIDVDTFELTLTGSTACSIAFTSTATENAGAVRWVVPEGATIESNYIKLTGTAKFIKDGPGAYSMLGSSVSYSGGFEIREGWVSYAAKTLNGIRPFGTGVLTIGLNAGFNLNGSYRWNSTDHKILLDGGSIANGGTDNTYKSFAPSITLLQDSRFSSSANYNISGPLDLDGHQLEISVGKTTFTWQCAPQNGTIAVSSGTLTFTAAESLNNETVSYLLESDCALNLTSVTTPLKVKDFSFASANSVTGPNGLTVYGVLTPKVSVDFPCTLLASGSLDLSEMSEPWIWSTSFNLDPNLTTLTIDIKDRKVTDDEYLIKWGEEVEPSSVEFALAGDDSLDLEVDDTGIRVVMGDTAVASAVWKGPFSTDLLSPENWTCYNANGTEVPNAFPTELSTVTIPYRTLASFNYDGETLLNCASVSFTGDKSEKIALTGDCDWRTLGEMELPENIDLAGHTLKVTLNATSEVINVTVTSEEENAELHLFVNEGVTYENADLSVSGAIKLVKAGKGVLSVKNGANTYAGGTLISDGVLKCGVAKWNFSAVTPFGSNENIEITQQGILDPAGSYNWSDYTIEMTGGAISNTVAQAGTSTGTGNESTAYNAAGFHFPFNPTLNLAVDSSLISTTEFNFKGIVKANGHKLVVKAPDMRWVSHDSEAATVEFCDVGRVRMLKNHRMKELNLTLIMNNSKFDIGGNWSVLNYVAKSESAIQEYRGAVDDNWSLAVYGAFCPETGDFLGCVMQDGSTLDLTAQDGSFNLYNPQGQKNVEASVTPWLCQHVTFANDATVTIDVHDRELSDREKVVEWSVVPTNLEGLTFELDDASKTAGYKIKKTDEGLFVLVDTGSEMTVEEIKEALPKGLDGVEIDWTKKTAAEIKKILNTKADNGLSVNENIILGIPQEESGQFEKMPYLKAEASADVGEGQIKFAFGGITPKTDKADIKFEIFTCGADGNWTTEVTGDLVKNDPIAALPMASDGGSAVKYFKVRFNISEKAE